MCVSMMGIVAVWASARHGSAAAAMVPAARDRKSRREFLIPNSTFLISAVPRVSHGWRVHVALHLEHQLLSAAWPELDSEKRGVDRRRLASGGDADQLMLSVAAPLYDQRA